jgi:hypothetical protein
MLAGSVAAQDNPAVIAGREALRDGATEEAIPILEAAALAGDMRAQNVMGHIYEMGDGRPVDMDLAMHWYGLAAEQGYPRAMFNLGYILRYGEKGVAADKVEGRLWIARAAALDYPPALTAYGDMLLHGEGGPEDIEQGIAFLEMAVRMEDSDAIRLLGIAHLEGLGVAKDEAEARRLFEQSAAQGNRGGLLYLGRVAEAGLGGPVDLALAAESYRGSMETGFDLAGGEMAQLIAAHPEVDPRPHAAAAHCLWGYLVADRVAEPDDGWPAFCDPLLEDLTPEEMSQVEALAWELPSAP